VTDLLARQTNGGVILTWTAPSSVATLTNLDIRYDTSPFNILSWNHRSRVEWLTDPGLPGMTQTAIVTGLAPNTNYYFSIRVQDSNGQWSTMSSMTFSTTGDSTYTVNLAWTPSPDAAVVKYYIFKGTESRSYSDSIDVGNTTSCSIAGLEWGVVYYYTATAAVTNGVQSVYANEIRYSRP
jgi:hypothetical protein